MPFVRIQDGCEDIGGMEGGRGVKRDVCMCVCLEIFIMKIETGDDKGNHIHTHTHTHIHTLGTWSGL